MDKVVLDTNVIISANLSSQGPPSRIVNMVFNREVELYYSMGILAEYKEVLSRKRFSIPYKTQEAFINAMELAGILVPHPRSN